MLADFGDKILQDFAPIAQWIEHQPAELGIQVRFLLGAPFDGKPILRREWAFFYTFSTTFWAYKRR